MAMTSDDYHKAGLMLLPDGAAWDKSENSPLSNVMRAAATEFTRIDAQSDALMLEALPNQTLMLLKEWETFTGLPDCTIDDVTTIENRRGALAAKIKTVGTLSMKALEQLAAERGYKIRIVERYPHHCMRPCTYPLYSQSNWFTAFIYVDSVTTRPATTLDKVTTRLTVVDSGDLECLLERYKPAHINFIYLTEDN